MEFIKKKIKNSKVVFLKTKKKKSKTKTYGKKKKKSETYKALKNQNWWKERKKWIRLKGCQRWRGQETTRRKKKKKETL